MNTSEKDHRDLRKYGDAVLIRLAQKIPGPEYGALWDALHDGRATTTQIVRVIRKIEQQLEAVL